MSLLSPSRDSSPRSHPYDSLDENYTTIEEKPATEARDIAKEETCDALTMLGDDCACLDVWNTTRRRRPWLLTEKSTVADDPELELVLLHP